MTGFDAIMARASRALVAMDYLACEADCLEALALARSELDFTAYRRALRPLQEARRARRMLAADAAVWLGPPPPENLGPEASRPARVLAEGAGCCCVEGDALAAARRLETARRRGLHAEVLASEALADRPGRWRVGAPSQVESSETQSDGANTPPGESMLFATEVDAPPTELVGVALHPDEAPEIAGGPTPRHWFMEASEAVGNTALRWAVDAAPAGTLERLAALETAVAGVSDHELLHQALADAANALEFAGGGAS